jgi:hypothetical protein
MRKLIATNLLILTLCALTLAQTKPTAAVIPVPSPEQQKLFTAALAETEKARARTVAAQADEAAAGRLVTSIVQGVTTDLKIEDAKWEPYLTEDRKLAFREKKLP